MTALALPSLLGGAVSAVTGLFGAKHDYRPARADEIYSMIQHGEPYSVLAARIIYKQKTGSHTDAGRAEYSAKWNQLLAAFPLIAAQAVAAGGLDDPTPGVPNEGTYVPNPASVPVAGQAQAAQSAQQLGAGASNAIANAINPGGGYATIPTNITTIVLGGLALLVVFFLVMRRR